MTLCAWLLVYIKEHNYNEAVIKTSPYLSNGGRYVNLLDDEEKQIICAELGRKWLEENPFEG